jgi:UV DNA damage repair endonuclease
VERTLWEITMNYHERQMLRWQEYANAKEARVKASIINDVSADEERHYKLLQSMGVVSRAPEKIALHHSGGSGDLFERIEKYANAIYEVSESSTDNDGAGEPVDTD